jgi:hypothetical protein
MENACSNDKYSKPDAKEGTGGGKIQLCNVGRFKLDADEKSLMIYRPAEGVDRRCADDDISCVNTIVIQYTDGGAPGGSQNESAAIRTKISQRGAKINNAAIVGDWLWVKDVNGEVWRYVVGSQPILDMLTQRWKGTQWKADDTPYGIGYQLPVSCAQIPGCKEFVEKNEDGWPGAPEAVKASSK